MKKIRTLVVDDSKRFRAAIGICLEEDPIISLVGSVGSGEECLRFIRKHTIDFILMDARMSGLDGPQTAQKVKKRLPRVKIIICTIWEKSEAKFYAEQAGADDYFVKGEPVETLLRKIHRLFRQK